MVVALLTATYAKKSHIALSSRYEKAFMFNLLCVLACVQVKAIAVQDPFVLRHNIAQNINNMVRDQLVQEISAAAVKVGQGHCRGPVL